MLRGKEGQGRLRRHAHLQLESPSYKRLGKNLDLPQTLPVRQGRLRVIYDAAVGPCPLRLLSPPSGSGVQQQSGDPRNGWSASVRMGFQLQESGISEDTATWSFPQHSNSHITFVFRHR